MVARLHHQLYAELSDRRSNGQGIAGMGDLHPLRGDPFRDFAPFATTSLGPETVLRLALPLSELQNRLNNLTNLDCFYKQLHFGSASLQRLLLQLESEGPSPLKHLLNAWPADQHDALRLSLTWLAKLGCIHWSCPTETR